MVFPFFGADEEQGRKTLHQHWQIWVQELNHEIVCLTQMLLREKMHEKHSADILTMLFVQVMDQIKASLTDALMVLKMMQGTKNCMMKSREELCSVLTVNRPYLYH